MRHLIRRTAVLAGAVGVMLSSGMGIASAAPPRTAALTFNPDHHFFAFVQVGEMPTFTFTLENTGDGNSGGVKVTLLSDSPELTITANTCRGNLHPGQSCMVTVQFAPTQTGVPARHAELIARGNPHAGAAEASVGGGTGLG